MLWPSTVYSSTTRYHYVYVAFGCTEGRGGGPEGSFLKGPSVGTSACAQRTRIRASLLCSLSLAVMAFSVVGPAQQKKGPCVLEMWFKEGLVSGGTRAYRLWL